MQFLPVDLPDIVLIEPTVYSDARGAFFETFHRQRFLDAGLATDFVQDNHSCSVRGTVRGLHYQIRQPQGKLVRVVAGEIYDVAVDLRRSSPHFGRWYGANLSAANRRQMYIPIGFAHGFCVVSDEAEVVYKCTDFYAPAHERTLLWNDPALGIPWPVADPLLSDKDRGGTPLSGCDCY